MEEHRRFAERVDALKRRRVEISTDAWKTYPPVIAAAFRDEAISYGIIDKDYGSTGDDSKPERRYSPSRIRGMKVRVVTGDPDMHVCTSHSERMNLTVRMQMKRYARLTNAHSKDIYHHNLVLAMDVWFYNFSRLNSAVTSTPAQAAGLTEYRFKLSDMLSLDMWKEYASAA